MKRLLTISFFSALLSFLKMASGLITAKAVAIFTGPSGIAMLGQLQNLIAASNSIVNAPLGNSVVRYTAENHDKGFNDCQPWWTAATQWSFGILLIIAPVMILGSNEISEWLFKNQQYSWVIVLICIALPFSAINTLITSVINGQQNYKRYIVLGMISTVTMSFIMIALIIIHGLNGALIGAAISSGISGIIILVSSFKQPWFKLKYFFGNTTHEHRTKIGGYVLMVVTSALTVPLSMVYIRNSLVSELGWDMAGQWQAVWKISESYLRVITLGLGTYYLPRLSSLVGVDNIKKEVNNTAKVILPIVILLSMTIFSLRGFIVDLLFTSEFSQATDLFAYQLCGDVFKVLGWLYAYPMISKGATKWFVISEVSFAILFIALSNALIPLYQANGVTLAYLINYALYFFFVYFNLSRFAK